MRLLSVGGGGERSCTFTCHTRAHAHAHTRICFPEVRFGLFDSCPLGYIWRGLHLIAKMDRRARSLVDEGEKNDDEKQKKIGTKF